MFSQFKYFISINVKYFIVLLNILSYYLYCYLYVSYNNNIVYIIPIISVLVIALLNKLINVNKVYSIPKPIKRFTYLSEDKSNVYIKDASIEEVILYLYDLEEYLDSIS